MLETLAVTGGIAEREKGRERDQRSRPHHGVDGAGGDPREEDRRHLQEGHCAVGSPGSPVGRRAPARSAVRRRRRGVLRLLGGGDRGRAPPRGWPARRRRPRARRARSAPMSTRVRGPSTLSGMPGQRVHRRAEPLERLADLARHDPHLVGVALGDLRHHLEVLVGQQRLVRAGRRGSPGTPSGWPAPHPAPSGSATPGRPARAGSATRGHPRRSGSRPACHPRR